MALTSASRASLVVLALAVVPPSGPAMAAPPESTPGVAPEADPPRPRRRVRSRSARPRPDPRREPDAHADDETREQPYTMAEVGAGLLTLPGADVCPTSPTQCEQGETSLKFSLHNFYRNDRFAIGAGIIYATNLKSDKARGSAELEREHSRSYFLVEGQARAYPIMRGAFDGWFGVGFGGVVVNDSWSVKADREPYSDTAYVGPRAATIGTEGVATSLIAGGNWRFSSRWSLGIEARYAMWFLPKLPEQSPTGDFASLKARIDMFETGLNISYRIPL